MSTADPLTAAQADLKKQIDILSENIERRQKRLAELISRCKVHVWRKLEIGERRVKICEVCATLTDLDKSKVKS